ncbi:MAG TPA: PIN domain-containing protein [Tepidiformaceae bacterium]|nr:PIN domain-containing protein [Tepidiformaceae bacterium]
MPGPLIRAVLDANVLYSATLSPRGLAARVVRSWTDGAFTLVANEILVAEFEAAIGRRFAAVPDAAVLTARAAELSALVLSHAFSVDVPLPAPPRFRDPNNDHIAQTAILGRADIIVTSDGDLLTLGEVEGIPIVSLHAFALTLGLTH